jgi:hypothetical protein
MITYDEYDDARGNYMGWCVLCKCFSREHTEPDIWLDVAYVCPDCGQKTVIGAEAALIDEAFEIGD